MEERELVVVEGAVGVDAEHEHARRGARAERQHHRGVRGQRSELVRGREGAGKPIPQPANHDGLPGAQGLRRCRAGAVGRRQRGQPLREAVRGDHPQLRRARAVRDGPANGGERDVTRVERERVECRDRDVLGRVARGREANGG